MQKTSALPLQLFVALFSVKFKRKIDGAIFSPWDWACTFPLTSWWDETWNCQTCSWHHYCPAGAKRLNLCDGHKHKISTTVLKESLHLVRTYATLLCLKWLQHFAIPESNTSSHKENERNPKARSNDNNMSLIRKSQIIMHKSQPLRETWWPGAEWLLLRGLELATNGSIVIWGTCSDLRFTSLFQSAISHISFQLS